MLLQQMYSSFSDKEKDQETGLNYYESRYYSSDIRRFVQPDSMLPNIYDPQQLNRYSYANNNPLKYTDPTGHAIVVNSGGISSTYFTPQPQKKSTVQTPAQQIAAIVNQPSKSQPTVVNSSSSGGPSSTGGVYQPQKDMGGARDVFKPTYNFLLGDDLRTFTNPNATLAQRGLAGVGIIGSVYLPAKGAKAAKAVEESIDITKGTAKEIKAGEFQFSKNHPGRVDEYHGISLDGTSQGIFKNPHSHTIWKNGEVMFHRDQFNNIVIQTWK